MESWNGRTPVSALQELMAARGHRLPVYHEEVSGINFKCTVHVEDITVVGYGTNKKTAKHESAKNALKIFEEKSKEIFNLEKSNSVPEKPLKNYVGELNEYSSQHGLSYPSYDFVTALPNGQFIMNCIFLDKKAEGRGLNKKDAKQDSARNMLKQVDSNAPITKFKAIQTKMTIENADEIISQFNLLSVDRHHLVEPTSVRIEPSPKISVVEEETVEALERQLEELGIEYSVDTFQTDPYVVYLVIKNTNFTFMQSGESRKDALTNVYRKVIEVKKSGCSFDLSFV